MSFKKPRPKTPPIESPEPDASSPPPEVLLAAIVDSTDDAVFSTDLNGIITSWNAGAERMLGYNRAEVLGRPGFFLVAESRHAEIRRILEEVGRGRSVEHYQSVRLHKNGRMIEVSATISPLRDAAGNVIGASNIARDVGERNRLGRADLLLAAIVSSSDDAIVSKNLEGIITSWNAGAERIFGYTAAEIIGQPVLKLLPEDRKQEEVDILARLRRGERVDHFETVRVRKNGERFNVSLTISPVKDIDGEIIGASKIARDITHVKRIAAEREQLLESERTARAQAEHANRMKDEFIATVSHELRTPLNAIVGWIEVIKMAPDDPAEVRQGIEVIERNARIQAQLIDDLLDLGRISSGKLALNVEPVDISAVVRQAIASVQHSADLKKIRLRSIVQEIHGGMMGDVKRLQQAVWNLLTNAIKFTPEEGQVMVTVGRTNSHVDIVVADSGIGIEPAFMPQLFQRFRQADASTTRQHGGLGIGLALVKQLVELHAGTVRAASAGRGKGATFTITLPIALAHVERAQPVEAPAEPQVVEIPDDLGGIKVLAVDDDRDSLEVLRRILAGRNARVQTATSAEEALKLFPECSPDVILSDIGMPGQDGYELIRRIRKLPKGAAVPAAALTALARSDDRMRALQAGYQTHLAKPVAAAEVVAVVRSLASLQMGRPGAG